MQSFNVGIKLLLCMIVPYISQIEGYCKLRKPFEVKVSYGLNANFFGTTRDEAPYFPGDVYFYKINLIGTITGASFQFSISKKSSVFVEYSRSINKGQKNFDTLVNATNGLILIETFGLSLINNIYFAGFSFKPKSSKFALSLDAGPVFIYSLDQDIVIENSGRDVILIEPRNPFGFQAEGGVGFGSSISKPIEKTLP